MAARLAEKQVSSGIMALAMAIGDDRFDRFLVSGFSFQLTQSFTEDPNIALRGTTLSRHKDSDITILQELAKRHRVLTTEPVVEQNPRLPLHV